MFFRVWLSKHLYEDIEANDPWEAIKKTGRDFIYKIEMVGDEDASN